MGDWNGDGISGSGIVDPATNTRYLRNALSAGAPEITPFLFGAAGATPLAGQDVPEPAVASSLLLAGFLGVKSFPRRKSAIANNGR